MRRLFFPLFVAVLCLGCAARPAAAQGLLPSSFGGWSASAPASLIPVSNLDSILGADATPFREYVVKAIEQRSYTEGPQTCSVTLYKMRDPSSAYGAYTFLRNDSATPLRAGNYATGSPDQALLVVGEMVIDIKGGQNQKRPSDSEIKQLADTLDKTADHTPYPFIGEHLPQRNRVPNTVRYVTGPLSLAHFVPIGTDDWMGYDHSAETILAKYRVAGREETLMITSYPTQQIAAEKFDAMLRRFTFDPPGTVPPGTTVLFGKRVSSYIAVVAGAPSQDAANKVLDEVTYESNVTWNEPHQTLTEPTIGSMVVGAFLGTGVIMVLAIAVGVGFGGFRVFVKIFFPNKVFDREKQIEILQLGIASKPIKAKDFY